MASSPVFVKGLHKSFHGSPVLKGIDIEIPPGKLTVIVGRSGCGKSTLLRCINGIEVFDRGSVSFASHTLESAPSNQRRRVREFEAQARQLRWNFGMVFQSFNLFPHLTVLENLTKAPVVARKIRKDEAEKNALLLLEKVGLSSHLRHYPAQLSGGQQQRAAIARALAMSPSVMLYDEPTSALDPWLIDEVFQVMRTLHAEGMTQVVVTHEMRFAREVADRILFMEEGNVIEFGPTEQMFTAPRDPRTKQYLSRFCE